MSGAAFPATWTSSGLPGKTLGIVGFGHTGIAMAALGKAFGMKVMVYTRSPSERAGQCRQSSLCADAGDAWTAWSRTVGRDHAGHAADRRDLPHVLHGAVRADEAVGLHHQHGARAGDRRGRAAGRPDDGQIAGAGLDVFDQGAAAGRLAAVGPAQRASSRRTRHRALPDKTQRSIDMIVGNIARYRAGRPMLNAISQKGRLHAARGQQACRRD